MIQCAAPGAPIAFLRFELNPAAVGPSGVDQFRALVPEITKGTVSYEQLAQQGKVTRVDIAVDLVNIDLEDLLINTAKPGVTNGYFGITGKAETKYLNVNKKGSKLYVYDRKALLQKASAGDAGPASEFGNAKYTRSSCAPSPTCQSWPFQG